MRGNIGNAKNAFEERQENIRKLVFLESVYRGDGEKALIDELS